MICSCRIAVRPDLLCSAVCLLIHRGRPGAATSAAKHRVWAPCCPTPLTLVAVSGVCCGKRWWCVYSWLSTMGIALFIFIHLRQDWCSDTMREYIVGHIPATQYYWPMQQHVQFPLASTDKFYSLLTSVHVLVTPPHFTFLWLNLSHKFWHGTLRTTKFNACCS